jgi:hypothetical protein
MFLRNRRISKIDLEEKTEPKAAVIHFEKSSAAKTALMVRNSIFRLKGVASDATHVQLNGGALDGAHLSVTSDTVHQDEDDHNPIHGEHIDQSDKPRAGSALQFIFISTRMLISLESPPSTSLAATRSPIRSSNARFKSTARRVSRSGS